MMIASSRLGRRPLSLAPGRVRVVHGCHDDGFPVAGYAVEVVRTSLRYVFNIGHDNKPLVNGIEVDRGHRLGDGDVLEFIRPWGRKGGLPVNRYGDIDVSMGVPKGLCHTKSYRPTEKLKRIILSRKFTAITAPSG